MKEKNYYNDEIPYISYGLLDVIFKSSRIIVIGWDSNKKITRFNLCAERITGFQEMEVVGTALENLLNADRTLLKCNNYEYKREEKRVSLKLSRIEQSNEYVVIGIEQERMMRDAFLQNRYHYSEHYFAENIEKQIACDAKRQFSLMKVSFIVGNCKDCELLIPRIEKQLLTWIEPFGFFHKIGSSKYLVCVHINQEERLIAFQKDIVQLYQKNGFIASITTAMYPQHGKNVQRLLKRLESNISSEIVAEQLVTKIYKKRIVGIKLEKARLNTYLQQGILKKQFNVFYQPQININTGAIIGMDTMIRWKHPLKGLLLPAEFLPLAKRFGYIKGINELALMSVCAQHRLWESQNYLKIDITFNLSACILKQKACLVRMIKIVLDSKMDCSRLKFKFVSAIALDSKDVIWSLDYIRKHNIKVIIGYHQDKLEGLLASQRIDSIYFTNRDTMIAAVKTPAVQEEAMYKLKSNNIEILVEGVETLEQFNYWKEKGCDRLQGHLFCSPLPAYLIERLICKS